MRWSKGEANHLSLRHGGPLRLCRQALLVIPNCVFLLQAVVSLPAHDGSGVYTVSQTDGSGYVRSTVTTLPSQLLITVGEGHL